MSVISRSSRLRSAFRMALRRSAWGDPGGANSSVSTAERSEVSGFFSSCATSAAKRSMASMRADCASVIASSERVRTGACDRDHRPFGADPVRFVQHRGC